MRYRRVVVLTPPWSAAMVYCTGATTYFGKTAQRVQQALTVSHFQPPLEIVVTSQSGKEADAWARRNPIWQRVHKRSPFAISVYFVC
jgi:hypothetical protein